MGSSHYERVLVSFYTDNTVPSAFAIPDVLTELDQAIHNSAGELVLAADFRCAKCGFNTLGQYGRNVSVG